jgi:hypothetical protein
VNINNDQSTTDNEQIDGGGDDDVTKPLGLGDFVSEEVNISETSPRKKLSGSAILIIAVIAVAGIGLFSMRTLTRATAAPETPQEAEKSIEEFLDVVMQKSTEKRGKDGVIQVLTESYSERQVSVDDVKQNPFMLDGGSGSSAGASRNDPIAQRRATRTTRFEAAASKLRLGMILMGSQPLANVNNKVVRVGDKVVIDSDVEFLIVEINADGVGFVAEDVELGVRVEKKLMLRND